MRYIKTKNVYKASNFLFDCEKKQAWSYGHWLFSTIYKGRLVFNDVNYSNRTNKHQMKAKNLLLLGGGIFLKLTYKDLQDVNAALLDEINCSQIRIKNLIAETKRPKTHKTTNKKRLDKVKKLRLHIKEIEELLNK